MSSQDLVSIIIPVYKKEDTLERCINSVLTQKYENIEIILVDDGSPDRCGEICDKFSSKDSRVVVVHQSNKGVSAARNIGINYSQGDIVSFVDADDTISNDFVSALISKFDEKIEIVVGSGHLVKKSFHSTFSKYDAINEMILNDNFGVNVWGKLYKRRVLTEAPFPQGIKMGEDMMMLYKTLLNLPDGSDECVYFTSENYYHQLKSKHNSETGSNIADYMKIVSFLDNEFMRNRESEYFSKISVAMNYAVVLRAVWVINLLSKNTCVSWENYKRECSEIVKIHINDCWQVLPLKYRIAGKMISDDVDLYMKLIRLS